MHAISPLAHHLHLVTIPCALIASLLKPVLINAPKCGTLSGVDTSSCSALMHGVQASMAASTRLTTWLELHLSRSHSLRVMLTS